MAMLPNFIVLTTAYIEIQDVVVYWHNTTKTSKYGITCFGHIYNITIFTTFTIIGSCSIHVFHYIVYMSSVT